MDWRSSGPQRPESMWQQHDRGQRHRGEQRLFQLWRHTRRSSSTMGWVVVTEGKGAIFVFPTYRAVVTGWLIEKNLVGQSDFSSSVFNYNQAGIQLYARISTISGNSIASVHGAGLQVTDGYGSTCSNPLIEIMYSLTAKGNIFILGCSSASIVSNTISNQLREWNRDRKGGGLPD